MHRYKITVEYVDIRGNAKHAERHGFWGDCNDLIERVRATADSIEKVVIEKVENVQENSD